MSQSKSTPLTLDDVSWATRLSNGRAKGALEYANNLQNDPQKQQRLARQECKTCFYTHGVAGAAFTAYDCGICLESNSHPNTSVPKLCKPCAQHNNLCVRCTASMDGNDKVADPKAVVLPPGA